MVINLMQWTAPAPGIEVRRRITHEEAVHMQVSTIGLDLAKNVLQVHGINANENGSSQALPPICSCSGFRRFVKVLMPPPERRGPKSCVL